LICVTQDAFALLLAAKSPKLHLLGVSTVHGNASLVNTTRNSMSILEALGCREVPVFPGAAKPFCREAVHAENIHGDSGLAGTTILPHPAKPIPEVGVNNGAVSAIYEALSKTSPGTAWLVATGALTNIGLLFAIYPSLADHIAGLSIMGGSIGGFFTHAPLGRLQSRVQLSDQLHRGFPSGLPDDSDMTIAQVAKHFRALGLLKDVDDLEDEKVIMLLEQARQSFGNTTPYAEFNVSLVHDSYTIENYEINTIADICEWSQEATECIEANRGV
jgi:uridine nucleosidase